MCVCTILACWVLFIHSVGVSRTGTFIAVDAMMQRLKEKDDFNIYNFVTRMRTKRSFMVQNMVCMYIAIDFSNFPDCFWGNWHANGVHVKYTIIEVWALVGTFI